MKNKENKDPDQVSLREIIIIAVIWFTALALLFLIFWKVENISNI